MGVEHSVKLILIITMREKEEGFGRKRPSAEASCAGDFFLCISPGPEPPHSPWVSCVLSLHFTLSNSCSNGPIWAKHG